MIKSYAKIFIPLTFVVLILTNSSVYSQDETWGVNMILGKSLGDYKNLNDNTMKGVVGFLGRITLQSRIMYGLELGLMYTGKDEFNEELTLTAPNPVYEVSNNNIFLMPGLFVRLQPEWAFFRPYIEAHAGGILLLASTRYEQGRFSTNPYSESWEYRDFTYVESLGFGFNIRIHKTFTRQVFLDLRVRQTYGGKAKVLDETVVIDHDLVTVSFEERINFRAFFIGVTVY
jgi:hypothetical protein